MEFFKKLLGLGGKDNGQSDMFLRNSNLNNFLSLDETQTALNHLHENGMKGEGEELGNFIYQAMIDKRIDTDKLCELTGLPRQDVADILMGAIPLNRAAEITGILSHHLQFDKSNPDLQDEYNKILLRATQTRKNR